MGGAGGRPSSGVRPSDARPDRTQWADVAKGICILLVVLWHVVVKHYLQIDWHLRAPIPGAWGALGEQLLPLRMPLFFTISGMFAVGAVGRPWRVLGRSKLAKFGYLYAVWLLIHTAVLALAPDFKTDRAHGPLELLEQLTITPSNLWYLYALALYFAVAKAVRRVPPALVLAVALALSTIAAAGLLATPGNRAGVYQNLVFFLAGLYFRPHVERWAVGGERAAARAVGRGLRGGARGDGGAGRAALDRGLAGGQHRGDRVRGRRGRPAVPVDRGRRRARRTLAGARCRST